MLLALGGVYMIPGRLSPQSKFTLVPSHGHAHGVGVQRRFKICNAKYSARTVNLKGN